MESAPALQSRVRIRVSGELNELVTRRPLLSRPKLFSVATLGSNACIHFVLNAILNFNSFDVGRKPAEK
jgi:hypothetical protein